MMEPMSSLNATPMSFRFKKMSVKIRMRLLVWGAILMSVVMSVSFFLYMQSKWFERLKLEDLMATSDIICEQSKVALMFEDKEFLLKVLSSIDYKSNISIAMILDTRSSILAHYPETIGRSELNRQRIQAWRKFREKSFGLVDEDFYISPIVSKGKELGCLILIPNRDILNRQNLQLIQTALMVCLFVPMLVSVLLRRLRRSFLNPILELSEVSQRVLEEKKFSYRVEVKNEDELGVMSTSFNEMMDMIEGMSQQVKESKVFLENQIEKRTEQLNEANGKLLEELGERMRIANKLLEAKEKAEASDVAKSDFLSVMTHEIRTPLSGIIGMGELLKKSDLTPSQQEYADHILRSAHQQLKIIGDILDFTKIEAGEYQLLLKPLGLRTLIEDVAVQIAPSITRKGLDFFIDIPPHLPVYVLGDEMVLEQVLLNLLNNALKFTERGRLTIKMKALERIGMHMTYILEIRDTGVGIAKDKLDKVFERFTQADSSTSRKYGGTGLGLTICKNLVKLMDGSLTLDSVLGEGSTFKIELPLELVEDKREPFALSLPKEGAYPIWIETHEAEVGRLCRMHLENIGFQHSPDFESFWEGAKSRFSFLWVDLHGKKHWLDREWPILKDTLQGTKIKVILLIDYGESVLDGLSEEFQDDFFWEMPRPLFRYRGLPNLAKKILELDSGSPSLEAQLTPAAPADTHEKNLKLLIAEDDDVNLLVLESLLEQLELDFDTARNGQEALEMMDKINYDMVFMDCMMPLMDGYTATKTIRNSPSPTICDVIIIALTANASTQDRDRCYAVGMNDYLTKPINLEDIQRVLEKWTGEMSDNNEYT